MTIYAAIILLSATGSATRTLEVQDSIAGVVVQVILGGVRDVLRDTETRGPGLRDVLPVARTLELQIDGQPRAGVIAWGTAALRVAGYVCDTRRAGSVSYTYRVFVRGFDVRRETRISDGIVVLTTDVYGSIGPRGELYHVRLVLDGHDLGDGTRLRGTATGWSRIGDRCRLVERFASREIRKAMLEVLDEIQRGGTGLYHAGSAEQLIEALR